MIQVKVKIFSQPVPEILDLGFEEGTCVETLLARLQREAGDGGRKSEFLGTPGMLVVLMNGQSIYSLSGWKTILHDGDEISFLPMVAGG
ncbi:MAG TPA: MoaD/ThiS family protein [Thermodesulfobacteriota bacterium]|nr:MoaD/ThiS family protein [Thermodesulfobacteriota bacterium]